MNSHNIIIILVVIVIIGAGAFFLFNDADEQLATEQTPTVQRDGGNGDGASSPANADRATVTYTDNGFSPSSVTITEGGTVTFVNDSSQGMWVASVAHPTHMVYAGTSLQEHCGNGADNDAFDACQPFGAGESYSFTFEKAGTWRYHNHMSARDTGSVIVTE